MSDVESFNNDPFINSNTNVNTELDNDTVDSNFVNLSELKNHPVVGSRNEDSTTDSQRINLDTITFEDNSNDLDVATKSFHSLSKLKDYDFSKVYDIISSSQLLIFVDNYKLEKRHNFLSNILRRKIDLMKEEFPGCTFFPYEYATKLTKDIHILNNKIVLHMLV